MNRQLVDIVRGVNGQLSSMRVMTILICLVVLCMWIGFCFVEGRFIPLSWEMVTLLGGAQGAKALQLRFEAGAGGVHPPNLREALEEKP